MRQVSAEQIATRRLAGHGLTRAAGASVAEVVAAMGAVQAQDSLGAKWAVGVRLPPAAASEAQVDQALADGSILRIHAMRGTWQLVAPADARWLLALVGPRVLAKAAPRFRQLGLDEGTFRRCLHLLEGAVGPHEELTRAELRMVFARGKVDAEGERLSHILGRAELEGLLCSGRPRGRQPTWTQLARWAAPLPRTFASSGASSGDRSGGATIDRAAAAAELARRYFTTRGPATLDDFVWWSGLTVAEARAGLDGVSASLVAETYGGRTTWRSDRRAAKPTSPSVHLLPAFDEYFVAYRHRDAVVAPAHARRLNAGGGMLSPSVVIDGKIAGLWRRTLGPKQTVSVTTKLFTPPTPDQRARIDDAIQRYTRFLGRELR